MDFFQINLSPGMKTHISFSWAAGSVVCQIGPQTTGRMGGRPATAAAPARV